MSAQHDDKRGSDAARFVAPDVSEARVARIWQGVSAGLDRPRLRSRGMIGAVLVAGAVAVAGGAALTVWRSADPAPSVWENAAFETASDALAVTLVDGSALELSSRSRVEVRSSNPSAVGLKLERGRITCDVTHRPGRSFTVSAGGIEVRVVGTRFSVANELSGDQRRVEVRVERGVVEVHTSDPDRNVVRLGPGQSFAQVTEHGAIAKPAERRRADVSEPRPSAVAVAPPAPKPSAPEAPESRARELLEEANSFRRSGDVASAARAYDELMRRYPSDGRAGLAAFELGRLRMDRLGDLAGAAVALERALALAPSSGFREDALARLVTVYARLGDTTACARARSRYLSSYPNGVHRQAVAARCGTE